MPNEDETKETPAITREEAFRLWVKALRSGSYQQARQALKDDTGAMCCLGVACDVIGPYLGGEWDDAFYEIDEWQDSQELPEPLGEFLGIGSDGYLKDPVENQWSLVDLNDDEEYTFAQIADVIESQWLSFSPAGAAKGEEVTA